MGVIIMEKKDIFTSLVRVKGDPNHKVIPVKSSKPIEKILWREFSKVDRKSVV